MAERTISYYSLPKNDHLLVKINDLHIQHTIKSIRMFSSFALGLYVLAIVIGVWVLCTENTEQQVMSAVGICMFLIGVISALLGLRAASLQSRRSSLQYYLVLRVFAIFMELYLLVVYVMLGYLLPDFSIGDLLWMGTSWATLGLIFFKETATAREFHSILVASIKARQNSSDDYRAYR